MLETVRFFTFSHIQGVLTVKTIFTTGQVAKICKVAPRTVSKWFDSGRLRGYRIPGSKDRRIPRENLIRFMKDYGIPVDELEDFPKVVLFLSPDPAFFASITSDQFVVRHATSAFNAGVEIDTYLPQCIVIDCAGFNETIASLWHVINEKLSDFEIMGVGDPEKHLEGFGSFVRAPFDPNVLIADIERKCGKAVS